MKTYTATDLRMMFRGAFGPWGLLWLPIGSLAAWAIVIFFVILVLSLTGCASAPARWEIVGVSGTRYAAVYHDDCPLAPGSYIVRLTSATEADVIVRGRVVGHGPVRVVSGKPDSIRIDITPGTTQVVVQ